MHTGSVNAAYWGIVAVLVAGTALVAYGWLSDRTATRRTIEALNSPPDRAIPGRSPKADPPHYLVEPAASTRPEGLPSTDLDVDTRDALRERLATAPRIPVGWPSRHFVTDGPTGWCVLDDPIVLLCDEPPATVRELLPALARARSETRPLVVVAPDAAPEVVATLRTNLVQGTLPGLILIAPDEDDRTQVADHTGATPVPRSDLQSGYLPATTLGRCATWVSDEHASWLIPDADPQPTLKFGSR